MALDINGVLSADIANATHFDISGVLSATILPTFYVNAILSAKILPNIRTEYLKSIQKPTFEVT